MVEPCIFEHPVPLYAPHSHRKAPISLECRQSVVVEPWILKDLVHLNLLERDIVAAFSIRIVGSARDPIGLVPNHLLQTAAVVFDRNL